MYSTHNESKAVMTERSIKTLKTKIYQKMTDKDNKSHLSDLNKLVDQYNNAYLHTVGKKPIQSDCSSLNEKIETNPKDPKF